MRHLSILVMVALAGLAGCGNRDASVVSGAGDGPGARGASDGTRYTTTTTVLESPAHGPQLCLGGVATSLPPQCGGPDVIGWDWDDVEGEESRMGTTWGEYTVVGTWDGEALTLTEPPSAPDPGSSSPAGDTDFATPCEPPEGGWQVVDRSKATDAAMTAAIDQARAEPDFGGAWIDQSINPAAGDEPVDETSMNDPRNLILNLSFTGDLAEHEAAIRETWGGALCVSKAAKSYADLQEIRTEVQSELDDLLYSSVDEVRSRVQIGVAVDDGLQARLDDRYGEGVVDVEARLRPVED